MTRAPRVDYLHDYYIRYRAPIDGRRRRSDAQPLAEHVQRCLDAGFSLSHIARESGAAESTLRRLLRGDSRQVLAATAEAILRVRPQVSVIGLVRRLQALAALGWSSSQIAQAAGLGARTIASWRAGEVTQIRTAAAGIVRAYDTLSMRTPVGADRLAQANITRVQRKAARAGYAPPLAWDDDTIDDPNARPNVEADPELIDHIAVERAIQGDPTILTKAERVLAVEHLAARGMCDADIGRQLGVTSATVLRDRQQHRIPSRWAAA